MSYHEDERDGVVRMCKLALHQKYPKYATEGFEALYSRPPVIYISAASRSGLGHYICSQVGNKFSLGIIHRLTSLPICVLSFSL